MCVIWQSIANALGYMSQNKLECAFIDDTLAVRNELYHVFDEDGERDRHQHARGKVEELESPTAAAQPQEMVGGADAQAFVVPQELVDAQKTPYGAAKQELQVAKCRKRISIGENEPMFSFQFHQLSIRAMTSMA